MSPSKSSQSRKSQDRTKAGHTPKVKTSNKVIVIPASSPRPSFPWEKHPVGALMIAQGGIVSGPIILASPEEVAKRKANPSAFLFRKRVEARVHREKKVETDPGQAKAKPVSGEGSESKGGSEPGHEGRESANVVVISSDEE